MYGAFLLLGVLYLVCSTIWAWRRHYVTLKRSGVDVIVAPVYIGTSIWLVFANVLIPFFNLLPLAWTKKWIDIISPSWVYQSTTKPFDRQGDVIFVASPGGMYMTTNNADFISQICTRRNDFQKPVRAYKVIELFGQNVLSSEGSTWRAHRKATAPAFSEELHGLVWTETLQQTAKMFEMLQSRGNNSSDRMDIDDLGRDTTELTLHIISKAGFGVPMSWPGQESFAPESDDLADFGGDELLRGHELTFKRALEGSVKNILWFAVFSPRTLRSLPLSSARKAWQAWTNFDAYLNELLELKRSEVSSAKTKDLMTRLVEASHSDEGVSPETIDTKPSGRLTSSDITGNTFVFLVAGHETSSNSILHTCLLLAANRAAQRQLQKDIDQILQDKPLEQLGYEEYYDRFANGMVGAVIHEQLRLLPPVILIPKQVVTGDQTVTFDGRTVLVPNGTFIHIPAVALHRNIKYWPHKPSARTKKSHDLDDFVPTRWLTNSEESSDDSDPRQTSRRAPSTHKLYNPPHGSFVPFSEGQRGCLGRRFALVEMTAALVSIFSRYSIELSVSQWASDEQVAKMSEYERAKLYQKAVDEAYRKLETGASARLTLQLDKGNEIPVRFVRRGKETVGFD